MPTSGKKREDTATDPSEDDASSQPAPVNAPDDDGPPLPFIVALGASAGGLEPLQTILEDIPENFPAAILITQHLAKDHASHLVQILSRKTKIPLREARRGTHIKPGHAYVCGNDGDVGIGPGDVIIDRPPEGSRPQRVDFLFTTLAAAYGERAIAVILSGTGSDGTSGALVVKRAGGTVIAESEESARYFGMPNAAISTGSVDFVRGSGEIAPLLMQLIRGDGSAKEPFDPADMTAILESLRLRRGTTFDQYRTPTLRRRLHKRMLALNVESLAEYRKLINNDPNELDQLFDTLLINVTEFFRDPAAWEALAKTILPDLVARRRRGQELRIWCAGCASGEEAYTLAIVLAEAMDDPTDWEKIKIFATDVDDDALATARTGRYDIAKLQNISPTRFSHFFGRVGTHYEIIKPVRRMVIFGMHDLTKDPPIGRLDLLVCRNVLIYFDLPLQRRLGTLFRYSLRDGGWLFLGRSEAIPRGVEGFDAIDRTWRIYTSRSEERPPTHLAPPPLRMTSGRSDQRAIDIAMGESSAGSPHLAAVSQYLLGATDILLLILDTGFNVQFANQHAEQVLSGSGTTLRQKNLLEVLENLRASDLRGLAEARLSRRRAKVETVQLSIQDRRVYLDLTLEPVSDEATVRGFILVGQDVTAREETRSALRDRARELQETVEELQTTNEELQSANEELVTANEELQSANEELATLNEEFQSTNEELETTNEELQSTNTELAAVNQELQSSAQDLEDLTRVISGMGAVARDALIVCDAAESVLHWSDRAKEFFGQHREDVLGRNIYSLDLGLDPSILRDIMAKAREESGPLSTDAIEVGEGKRYRRAKVTAQRLKDNAGKLTAWVIAFHDIASLHAARTELQNVTASNEALLELVNEGVVVIDAEGIIQQTSELAKRILARAGVEVGGPVWDVAADRPHVLQIKGAIAEMTRSEHTDRETHTLSVIMRDGTPLHLTIKPVGLPGTAPLILLHAEPQPKQ